MQPLKVDNILKIIFAKLIKIWLKPLLYVFLVVQMVVNKHWFGLWPIVEEAKNHCLNQWWHICKSVN